MRRSDAAPRTIDAYIAGFAPDVREALSLLRATIADVAPHAQEAMKYGLPTFVLNGNLVHFGAFRSHIGLYPTPSGIRAFKSELSGYESAKGSVRFPLDRPLPLGLIRRIVAFRVREATRDTSS